MPVPGGPCVLVLHRMGNPALVPAFLPRHMASVADAVADGAVLFHDVSMPLPKWVKDLPFDAVLLDVTLLATRWMGPGIHGGIRAEYAFVRDKPWLRIAFPQDEYDCSALLDDWMCDWRMDLVVSVVDGMRGILYPRYCSIGRIETGYTGYVDEAMIDRPSVAARLRPIDVGYRAKLLPPYFGRVGEVKWTVGRDFLGRSAGLGLRTDIRVGDGHALPGGQWLRFVESCRAMLATPSGSSLLDPDGSIQRRVRDHRRRHPGATFEQVEASCFPGLDGIHRFTAISPRVIEAALARTVQCFVDGDYSGIVDPREHGILLEADASNIGDVVRILCDASMMDRLADRCREAVLSVDRLRLSGRNAWLRGLILEHRERQRAMPGVAAVREGVERYRAEMAAGYRRLWRRQALESRVRGVLDRAPPSLVSPIRAAVARFRGRA